MSDILAKGREYYNGKKIVLLASGGLDSMGALVALCYYGAREVQPLFIKRGQSNYLREEEAIKKVIASPILRDFQKVILPLFTVSQDIPAEEMKIRFKGKVPVEDLYFARNSDLVNSAARLAHCLNTEEREKDGNELFEIIATGSVKTVSIADEKKGFFQIKQKEFEFLATGLRNHKQKSLRVIPPFSTQEMNKEQAFYHVYQIDNRWIKASNLTWSCWEGGEHPCGRCGACNDRQMALERADRLIRPFQQEWVA